METTDSKQNVETKIQPELPKLPFTYLRTNDPDQAQFHDDRISRVKLFGKENKPQTNEEILAPIIRTKEHERWFSDEYWRKKGLPQEQVEFRIGDKQVTIYNFNKEKPFSDDHIAKMQDVFEKLATHFPENLSKIRWILIDDIQLPSVFGDSDKYPINGEANDFWSTFILYSRGMELIPHRIQAVSNFEGTIAHETTHLIDNEFLAEWEKNFKWKYCDDFPNEWEVKKTPDGTKKRFFNRQTGEMSPQGKFPVQPEQCVTNYGKQTLREDIAESMVAYLYDPALLKQVSLDKYDILQKHDANKTTPEVLVNRIPKGQIKLPEIKPEIVYYHIQEPDTKT